MDSNDDVKKPGHYQQVPGVECKEVVKHFAFMPGAALKYIWRHGRKLYPGLDARASAIRDLEKAIECASIEILRLKEGGKLH